MFPVRALHCFLHFMTFNSSQSAVLAEVCSCAVSVINSAVHTQKCNSGNAHEAQVILESLSKNIPCCGVKGLKVLSKGLINLHVDVSLPVRVCFTRPGRATGNADATLVGQCAINPFISTSPSLLSASISPLTHHPSIHPPLPTSRSLSCSLKFTKCPRADYFLVLNEFLQTGDAK